MYRTEDTREIIVSGKNSQPANRIYGFGDIFKLHGFRSAYSKRISPLKTVNIFHNVTHTPPTSLRNQHILFSSVFFFFFSFTPFASVDGIFNRIEMEIGALCEKQRQLNDKWQLTHKINLAIGIEAKLSDDESDLDLLFERRIQCI